MIALTVADIARVVDGRFSGTDGSATIRDVVVDSRSIPADAMFVAIAGERVDGHDFAAEAVAAGAVVVLAGRDLVDSTGEPLPCIVVVDPVLALGRLAGWVRAELLSCTVVAITGSSGKTSTKDLVGDVLADLGPTVQARGSFNTEVGVPLTVLAADEGTRYLVLEMGMRGSGHISYLAGIARPHIAVVVNVGAAHLGMLGSREAIGRAKGEIVEALDESGVAILNADDPIVRAMADRTRGRVVTFGESPRADVRARGISLDSRARPSFDLVDARSKGGTTRVTLQLSGEHFVANALAAASVGLCLGASTDQVGAALGRSLPRSRWRMEVLERPDGTVVVNDAYNANPDSMSAALKTLVAMAAGRRTWAVLGAMRELGPDSRDEHEAIGRLAVRLGISRLVCVGEETRAMHLAASNAGSRGDESVHVADIAEAIAVVNEQVQPGDVVLVKASRSVGLEAVAEALMRVDSSAPELSEAGAS